MEYNEAESVFSRYYKRESFSIPEYIVEDSYLMGSCIRMLIVAYIIQSDGTHLTVAGFAKKFHTTEDIISKEIIELDKLGYISQIMTDYGPKLIVSKKTYDLQGKTRYNGSAEAF